MKIQDLPEFARKYKQKGYDVRKQDNTFYLYKVNHQRVKDKPYPVTSFIYIGKIDETKGLIKAWTQKDKRITQYLEFGLSNYLYSHYRRACQRSLFNVTGERFDLFFKLGIIDFIFGSVTLKTIKLSYLTFKLDPSLLTEMMEGAPANKRVKTVSKKLKSSLESVIINDDDRFYFLNSLRNMNAEIIDDKEKISTSYADDVKEIANKYGFQL